MTAITETLYTRKPWHSLEGLRDWSVALMMASSFFVKVEPAPTDIMTFVALALFLGGGLRFSRTMIPPLFFLFIYAALGFVSCIPINNIYDLQTISTPWLYSIVMVQISLAGILLAGYILYDVSDRYQKVERSYIVGGVIGAIVALLLFAQVSPVVAFFEHFGYRPFTTEWFRATGGFKDPNVFSTWLCFPVVAMLQALMLGRMRVNVFTISCFFVMGLALVLAQSRGAWFVSSVGGLLTIILTTYFTPSRSQARRLITMGLVGIVGMVIVVVVIFTTTKLGTAIADRFTLLKSYDAGEMGRFGSQINSIPMLLELPLGFGPFQFATHFPEAPHNTFLNAFAAAGWIGGVAYLLFFITNFIMGIRAIFTRSPYQAIAIPVFTTLLLMMVQGLQIDNEHWRHIYWMMGIGWAVFAASQESVTRGFTKEELLAGWNLSGKAGV